jgi:hypothetical protein
MTVRMRLPNLTRLQEMGVTTPIRCCWRCRNSGIGIDLAALYDRFRCACRKLTL